MTCESNIQNDGSNSVSLKPIASGMAEFWASTGGRMAGYASCWSTCFRHSGTLHSMAEYKALTGSAVKGLQCILQMTATLVNCALCCECQSLTMNPEARMEATMQHEITRLTSENLVSCLLSSAQHQWRPASAVFSYAVITCEVKLFGNNFSVLFNM